MKESVFERLMDEFVVQMIMLLLFYVLVLVMIFLDLWSGIRKARQRGEYRSSIGLRRTGVKVAHYFNVLMLMTVIDLLQMIFIWHLNSQVNIRIPIVPVFTFCMSLFYGIIEGKSMYEKTGDKSKARYQDAAKLVKEVLANREAQEIVINLTKYFKSDKTDSNAAAPFDNNDKYKNDDYETNP